MIGRGRPSRWLVSAMLGVVAVAGGAFWLGGRAGAALPPGDEPIIGPIGRIPFAVRLDAVSILDVARADRPYARIEPPALVDELLRDASGVRVYRAADGEVYDHPVAQAQDGLAMVEGFRISRDRTYLDRAIASAERLLAGAVRHGGGLYLPYRFDFPLHGNPDTSMHAPWYSGMAQGQALSLFVRLHEVTGDRGWLDAADAVFRTFLIVRPPGDAPGTPWIAFVDEAGYYWPEEYPDAVPDRTFNGIVFAAYGLIDYHFATDDPDALRLAQATLTTARAALPQIRVPGQISRYCLEHGVQDERYHRVHIGQMRTLARITADPRFAEWERLLRADADP